MDTPVLGTVRFSVTARPWRRVDHWAILCLETGIITYGATREAAEALNGKANVLLVKRYKEMGRDRLEQFMTTRGITYSIALDSGDTASRSREPERFALAA